MMRIDVVTLFPEFFSAPLDVSIVGRARQAGIVAIHCSNPRDFTADAHRTVDDSPYGGGPGMVMKPEPLFETVRSLDLEEGTPVVVFTPQGRPLKQRIVRELAQSPRAVMICGRYEGIDERVRERLATHEISLGDFVLSGGELPALVLIDAIVRLLPGALGNEESPAEDSFSHGLLEHPQYTRPPVYEGMAVPDELVNGYHARVDRWRRKEALWRTYQRRPELLGSAELSDEDHELLAELMAERL